MATKKAAVTEPSAEALAARNQYHAMGARPIAKLRELGQASVILDEWLVETEGEETPEIAELWERLQGEKEEKVQRWGLYLIDRDSQAAIMEAEEKFFAEEAERLRARRIAFDKQTERSRASLLFQLVNQNIDRVEGIYCTVARQLNNPKVVGEPTLEQLEAWYTDATLHRFVKHVPESFALDRPAVLDAARTNAILAETKAFPKDDPTPLPEGVNVIRTERVVVK